MLKILLLTNNKNEIAEDYEIAKRLEADGHFVETSWLDYSGDLRSYDLILRRNVWVETESEVEDYRVKLDGLINKIKQLRINSINLEELTNTKKDALVQLSKINENWIIPTRYLDDIDSLGDYKKFVVKEIDSAGSAFGQYFASKEEIKGLKLNSNKYIVQPKISFCSEVQFYYVGQELMYVLEYSPSKFPDYPKPRQIYVTYKEKFIADFYAVGSGFEYGFLRIDFLRTVDGSIKLMEMEATSPHMCFKDIPIFEKQRVIEKYISNVYAFVRNQAQ
ncbi:hypothetical protein [Carnobacterium maltaromaticum]|uniref:hypothetical protein n=1 Tax=Carnobacterium maltaromaticum TaxID=2751 RepID=UPI00191BA60E|nr:hypothetical protein [Carnobacterium maltaromaticum]CAD5903003.1 conserved hypothetical protein [Carnobacterium maltaromaticum]